MQNPGFPAGVFACWAFAHGFRRRALQVSVMQAAAPQKTDAGFGEDIMHRSLPLLASVFLLGISTASPARSEDLHIGFLAPRTGIFTQLGTDMVNGFQMYLDEHDGMLGGAKVTFIVEDDQGKPDVDVTKAKKLILQDKVDMLVGAVLATSAYALAPVSTAVQDALHRHGVDRRRSRAAAGFDKYPYLVLAGWVPSQPNHPLGQWACDHGYKRIAAIAADYAFGYEQTAASSRASRTAAARSCRKSGCRSAPRISAPIFRRSRAMSTPSSR